MIQTNYDRSESPPAPVMAARVRHPFLERERTIVTLADTGASTSCLPLWLAEELDLPVAGTAEVEAAGGATFACTRRLADIDVGSGTVRLAVLALPDERIVGRDLLNLHVVTFDGPRLRLTIGARS